MVKNSKKEINIFNSRHTSDHLNFLALIWNLVTVNVINSIQFMIWLYLFKSVDIGDITKILRC